MEQYCHTFFEAAYDKWANLGSTALTEKEKYVLAVETFFGEVTNGGLEQYLWNESGHFADWSVEAFDAIGIPTYSDMMRRVKELFPDSNIPEDADQREDFIKSIDLVKLEEVEEQSWNRYHAHGEEIRKKLYEYLKKFESLN